MSYVSINPDNLMPYCSSCGAPIPKTVAEVVLAISRWPIICSHCHQGANEIRITPSSKSSLSFAP